jgi:hypothetical protein
MHVGGSALGEGTEPDLHRLMMKKGPQKEKLDLTGREPCCNSARRLFVVFGKGHE